MGRRRSWLACALAVAALASPSAAWAQGAGDEQYTDPFAGEGEQGSGQEEEQPEPTPAPAEPEAPAPEPSAPAQPAEGPNGEPQLPRTGADAGLLALGGTLLLAGGVALRVRISEPRPRRRWRAGRA
jgi:LPXTG-motif cell wall-anchored protein